MATTQAERHQRILQAAVAIAREGGFDDVQMRSVADRAGVALGTLYRHFPSKVNLLVSALAWRFEEADAALQRHPVAGATPTERVEAMLGWLTQSLQREPLLTEALTRAFMSADASVAAQADAVEARLVAMLTRVMPGPGYDLGPRRGDNDVALSRVIADVWLSALVAWVTGRSSAEHVQEHVSTAVRLVLR